MPNTESVTHSVPPEIIPEVTPEDLDKIHNGEPIEDEDEERFSISSEDLEKIHMAIPIEDEGHEAYSNYYAQCVIGSGERIQSVRLAPHTEGVADKIVSFGDAVVGPESQWYTVVRFRESEQSTEAGSFPVIHVGLLAKDSDTVRYCSLREIVFPANKAISHAEANTSAQASFILKVAENLTYDAQYSTFDARDINKNGLGSRWSDVLAYFTALHAKANEKGIELKSTIEAVCNKIEELSMARLRRSAKETMIKSWTADSWTAHHVEQYVSAMGNSILYREFANNNLLNHIGDEKTAASSPGRWGEGETDYLDTSEFEMVFQAKIEKLRAEATIIFNNET